MKRCLCHASWRNGEVQWQSQESKPGLHPIRCAPILSSWNSSSENSEKVLGGMQFYFSSFSWFFMDWKWSIMSAISNLSQLWAVTIQLRSEVGWHFNVAVSLLPTVPHCPALVWSLLALWAICCCPLSCVFITFFLPLFIVGDRFPASS